MLITRKSLKSKGLAITNTADTLFFKVIAE